MKKKASSSAQKRLFCVSYVDTVFRETIVEARNKNEAIGIVEEQISDGVHHHAIDSEYDDMQAEPNAEKGHTFCFECGQ